VVNSDFIHNAIVTAVVLDGIIQMYYLLTSYKLLKELLSERCDIDSNKAAAEAERDAEKIARSWNEDPGGRPPLQPLMTCLKNIWLMCFFEIDLASKLETGKHAFEQPARNLHPAGVTWR